MEGQHTEHVRSDEGRATNRPVIGIFANPGNAEAVAGAILRAEWHGYDALVIQRTNGDSEAIKYANLLDTMFVNARSLEAGEDPKDYLTTLSKDQGYPGLIFQEDSASRIDFEASAQSWRTSDQYVAEAVLEPVTENELDVLVAIPAYNEEGTIADVVSNAQPYADEVLVVDDGSTDETAQRARTAGATVIEHSRNRGYGAALQSAFHEADRCNATHLVGLDGDRQHDPTEIPKLVETQEKADADIVIGSRFVDGSETSLPSYRRFGIQIVNLLTNLSIGVVRSKSRIADTQSGFRAYNRRAIESLAEDDSISNGMGASADILFHAHRRNYSIEEVGSTVCYNVENGSTKNPVSHGLHLVRNILRTIETQHPIAALGLPGLVSALLGIVFAHLTLAKFIESGFFPLEFALLSTFFVLAGIFASFTAIILHSLNSHFGEESPV